MDNVPLIVEVSVAFALQYPFALYKYNVGLIFAALTLVALVLADSHGNHVLSADSSRLHAALIYIYVLLENAGPA